MCRQGTGPCFQNQIHHLLPPNMVVLPHIAPHNGCAIKRLRLCLWCVQKLGVKEIVLDAMTVFGPGNLALTYDNILQLRIAAIDKEDANASFPIMGLPAAYWSQVKIDDGKELWEHQYQEIIMAAIMESIDTSLIVLHSGKE